MWKRGKWAVLFLFVFLLCAGSYNTKVYMKQGGDEQVVSDGGKITLESGGALDASGTATIAGILHSNLVDKSAEEEIAGKWTFSDLVASDTCVLHETSFSDSNITNVGDIALGTISADDGSSFAISSDWTNAGNTVADLGAVTTMDADGGTVDGTTVGASTPSTGAFTTLGASGLVTLSGSPATGIDFAGTYSSHALDFSSATQTAGDISLIRAGSYSSPMDVAGESQYGMVRLYLDTDDDGTSYNRGVFVCLKTTGTKGIFPIAGLAEVLEQSGAGPTKAQAAQFIAGLHTATSKLATAGGDATAGMYGAWLKIYSVTGSVAASGSRVAPVWVDNQMCGTVSGEEYGIFATTGGTRPDGFIGFETSSSGYDQFIYADTTFNSGAGTCMTTDAVPGTQDARIKVWYDGKQYYIPLYR